MGLLLLAIEKSIEVCRCNGLKYLLLRHKRGEVHGYIQNLSASNLIGDLELNDGAEPTSSGVKSRLTLPALCSFSNAAILSGRMLSCEDNQILELSSFWLG